MTNEKVMVMKNALTDGRQLDGRYGNDGSKLTQGAFLPDWVGSGLEEDRYDKRVQESWSKPGTATWIDASEVGLDAAS